MCVMHNELYEYKDTEWIITLLLLLLLSISYNSVLVAPPHPHRLPPDVGCCQSHRGIIYFLYFLYFYICSLYCTIYIYSKASLSDYL